MAAVRICGCNISLNDTDRLLELLDADITLVAHEAAGAIRFARDASLSVDRLDPDIRDVIKAVLRPPISLGLARLLHNSTAAAER
jgi:hypothetical protein